MSNAVSEGMIAMPASREGPSQSLPGEDNPDLRLRVGRHLGHIRKNKHISQEDAAKGIRISRPHLSNVEQGRARTGWEMLARIAAHYQLALKDVIRETELQLPMVDVQPNPASWYLDGDIVKGAGQRLTPYDHFMVGIFRLLSADRRRELRKYALKLVADQGDDAG